MYKSSFKMFFLCSFLLIQGHRDIFSQTTFIIQAEDADTINTGSIDNNHTGYTGYGFVNLDNADGTYVVFLITLPEGGDFQTDIRYSNGKAERIVDVIINDTLVEENLNFPSTVDWDTWDTVTINLSLISGLNVVKLIGKTSASAPNFDCIIFSNPNLSIFKPVAEDDSIDIYINQGITLYVLDNDYSYLGDEIDITSFEQPVHGTLVEMEDENVLRYMPEFNFRGEDTFTYTITDGNGIDSATVFITLDSIDWSVEVVEMILATKTPATVGNWEYSVGLLMEGILRVYDRTGDSRYLDFVNDWADLHVSSNGEVDNHFESLDNMMSGYTLLHLYSETGIQKYKLACDSIRKRYETYPQTYGGFWHMVNLPGEMWLDGLYMSTPFLAKYGEMFNDEAYTHQKVVSQYRVYLAYLMSYETGIPVHAYDADGSASWALSPLNRSPIHWGRSIGWVEMGLTDVLDIFPPNYPNSNALIYFCSNVLQNLATYQDTITGLWYQVVDMADSSQNWHETSCTEMYTYAMKRAIQKGYISSTYEKNMELGYMGVLSKISKESDGMVYLTDICQGTSVSADMDFYFNRARNTNDYRGLGPFLIMNEFVIYNNLP